MYTIAESRREWRGAQSGRRFLVHQAVQEVVELALFSRRETLESGRRPPHALQQLRAHAHACRGEHDVLHTPVLRRRPAGHEPACLEPVDKTGHVRVIACQHRRKLGHGQRRAKLQKRAGLGWMQI